MINEKSSAGAFQGLDIQTIQEGLGMVIPGSGEPGKPEGKKSNDQTDPPDDKVKMPAEKQGMKIQIPETEEERKQLEGIEDEGDESKKNEAEETEGQAGEEDALITEDSPLYLHAATLQEEGILPTLDLTKFKGLKHSEAIKTLLDAQKEFIEQGQKSFKDSLTPNQQKYLDLVEKGIDEEDAMHQVKIEDAYGKITDDQIEENEDLQLALVTQDLQLKGMSEKKIQAFVKAAKEEGTLLDEAKDSKISIDKYIAKQREDKIREAEKAQKEADDKEKSLQTEIKTKIDSLSEILPGIKISAAEKTKLYDYMTKPAGEVVIDGKKVPVSLMNKTREADRISFDLRLNYFIEMGMFNKDFDLSKLAKKVKSGAAAKLSEHLKTTILPTGGVSVSKEKKDPGKAEKIIFPNF